MFRRWSWGLLLCALMIGMAGGVSGQEPVDHPLEFLREQGFGSAPGLTQTIGDVTMTLDWVYADTQQFAVQFSIQNAPPEALAAGMPSGFVLSDQQGYRFSYSSGYTSPGAAPDSTTMNLRYYTQAIHETADGQWTVENDYFGAVYDSLPETLDLTFEARLEGGETLVIPPDHTPEPNEDYSKFMQPVEPVGTFTFDVRVPLYAETRLAPQQSVEAAGLTLTLEEVALTPSKLSARLCYELPDARDWRPAATLDIAGRPGYLTNMGVSDMNQFENTERRCQNLAFDTFRENGANPLTLTVSRLEVSLTEGPQDWERIRDILAEEGIEIEVLYSPDQQGIGLNTDNVPEDVDLQAAILRAREQLGDVVSGPWVFTVELP